MKKSSESLDELASEALSQIDEMKYAKEMRADGIGDIIKVGIAFRGKEMCVRTE